MKRILVIGDGQLGLMLAGAAARLGLVLDRLAPESAELFRGTARDGEMLPAGWDGAGYDIVTAEREHLPDDALMDRLRAHPGFSAARAIATLADRRSQKQLLADLGIPTARWCIAHGRGDIAALLAATGGSVVVKAAQGGYDGRGQWRVDADTLDAVPAALYGRLVAERRVDFRRELSLVGARGADGDCVFLPLVENIHHHGMLRTTLAPARVTDAAQRRAESMLRTIMEVLGYSGTMAMELFEESGELLVNELAPRVHNSGHWSQDGASLCQFELHLRALCGWPLPAPRTDGRRSLMLNLVGCAFDPRWLGLRGARLHWYGKTVRPGRKLGHLNFSGGDGAALAANLREALALLDGEHADALREALARLEAEPPDALAHAAPAARRGAALSLSA